ncbi:NAD(P)H-dependent flavin oxidoreductase [Paraburkholderia sp. BCC1885]|uniref:NAD(P)H-dependent flavin oxidoreductase n=1 Tax=Paraburkholderia sp. BCC1885 TaxID=2562669 RepID=UPI00391F9F25
MKSVRTSSLTFSNLRRFVLAGTRSYRRRTSVPVIAAGDVADGHGIAVALASGASAVQVGTAFLACHESRADPLRRKMLSARVGDTVLSKAFSGRLARGMRNEFIDAMRPHEASLPRYPIQSWFAAQLRQPAIASGRSDVIAPSAGQAASPVRRAGR